MGRESSDIFVSGGGIAGLMASAIFGRAGFSVICTDPTPPILSVSEPNADLRSTAFLQPAKTLLAETGIWPVLSDHATPLQVMQIADATAAASEPLVARAFDAADISTEPFGWNVPNWLLRRELVGLMEDLPEVTFLPDVATERAVGRQDAAYVSLSNGRRIKARLVVAADGRNSPLRQGAGISVHTRRTGQKALAFSVAHTKPHENVSTEIHRSGGPFTLVPLPDHKGQPRSAVVWMEHAAKARGLYEMAEADFEAALNERSAGVLGQLSLVGRRSIWPIILQLADRFHARRLALIAEAAHVVPPIGAQGLNMSLTDIAALRDLAAARQDGLGDAQMLNAYTAARWPDVAARVAGIGMLNGISQTGGQRFGAVRAAGIRMIHDLRPVRIALMRAGLGRSG
ncbi:MAG: FAD-dependent monooxygenase [Pseudomonadota bacterium]